MTTDAPARSRRALLAAGLAAGVATVASALGRPGPARAANGDAMLIGNTMLGTTTTSLYHYSGTAFYGGGDGGQWDAGVSGEHGAAGLGIRGTTVSGGIGVYGLSSGADPAFHPTKTGVYGYAAEDTASVGVRGTSATGSGVVGYSGTGAPLGKSLVGVYGQANQGTGGIGVRGHSTSGTGIYASSGTGTGLRVDGRVKLTNCAGITTILATLSSVTVTPGIDLTASSAVVATLQGNPVGTATVKSVSVDPATDTFTIILTGTTSGNVKVAWHVFG